MKYILILGDGMADYPVAELGGKTPLQAANKPGMDFIARNGEIGLTYTVPESVLPGSDTANLSVMGFDPDVYYTGRAPIEAVSMGINLGDDDIVYRCNLVSLSDGDNGRYEDRAMIDYSADEISTEEAKALIGDVNEFLLGRVYEKYSDVFNKRGAPDIKFYPGISYRHCMVWRNKDIYVKSDGQVGGAEANAITKKVACVPPHDIMTRAISDYLPVIGEAGGVDGAGFEAGVLRLIMKESYEFFSRHAVNRARAERGLLPANSLWLWGQGGRLALSSFYDKYGLKGAVISAVDLLKGIAISAGMQSIDVEGATGTIDTNYKGKADAALAALDGGCDFVYVHVEAPDECGHRNEAQNKAKSIEYIDEKIIRYIMDEMDRRGDAYSIMVLPDHATPLSLRTHTRDPIPFAIYRSAGAGSGGASVVNRGVGDDGRAPGGACYDEFEAAKSGFVVKEGYKLMDYFLRQ